MVVKCIVSYDGFNYCGWQIQPHANSIQACIEKALAIIHDQEIKIVGSGRTDTKVHALGQVFHFESDVVMSEERWVYALNRLLPHDIRILEVSFMSDSFHARFDCISKRYEYYVCFNKLNPFVDRYMAMESRPLDIQQMQAACLHFVGTHDFTSFTSSKINKQKDRVRTISTCAIEEIDQGLKMIFIGDGFLRYQIRMMSATLLEVGIGHLTPNDVLCMLEAKDKHVCRYKAEPQGLYLVEVNYKES